MRHLFILILLLYLPTFCGCVSSEYNLATQNEEMSFYSTEKEARLGRTLAKAVEKRFPPIDDAVAKERINGIGDKIAAVSDRSDVIYRFNVIENEEVNAFALPGGYVYLTSQLVSEAGNDDELACVIAHEIGHITARHTVKRLQANLGYNILMILIAREDAAGGREARKALDTLAMQYSREDEILADRLAVKYSRKAGYDPGGMLTFLNHLRDNMKDEPLRPKSAMRTHPYIGERIRAVKEEIGVGIDFVDYINTPSNNGQDRH